ncbi:MAG: ThuA domain-containing protein [Bacteroidales bacterium]|nr:ThuA domain-containing protein [Bacteroidales bacterium]
MYRLPGLVGLFSLFVVSTGTLFGQGFPPAEAARRMTVAEGFTVTAVAAEPLIRQPLSMSFDDRGRLWVLQYLQYPNPAGLKALKQDQYLRTVWDKVPEPPPHGTKGLDRITILSGRDANGVFTQAKDFLTGLNLASGFCIGRGGVYVVQPPYLLFYADKNADDVPDGDPEVLLSGFGFDDTHSVANSLQWGPDGWLYGAAGSTSTCRIRNPAKPDAPIVEFQQGIWRFHPTRKEFELFSEGGGNTFGLDFDKNGQVIAGTNYGNVAMLHQVQGGYYIKGFSKHGPLHNPYTFGYFDHVPYKHFKGGHVTCGGVVYQADAFPPEYRDQYIAGNLLANAIYWHKMDRKGSTFTAQHGGDLALANDTWFRPIDLILGPDGNIYMADWTDRRAAHLDPVDNWDKTNGRVFKIEYQGTKPTPEFDLRQRSSAELVALLKHPNKWWRNEARRLLNEKADAAVVPVLRKQIQKESGLLALESLWTLYQVGGWDESFARNVALSHPNEYVRAWAVRLLGDTATAIETPTTKLLVSLAASDPSPAVRSQLASTAKRLPAAQGLPIAGTLLTRSEDAQDPFLPLLIWWAFEDKVGEHPQAVVSELTKRAAHWESVLGRQILERVARRFVADDVPRWPETISLLVQADAAAEVTALLAGVELALQGRTKTTPPESFLATLRNVRKQYPQVDVSRILVRLGDPAERAALVQTVTDAKLPNGKRLTALKLLSEVRAPELPGLLPGVLTAAQSDALRIGTLDALSGIDDPALAGQVLRLYPSWSASVKRRAITFLTSRPTWALALFQAVDAGTFPKTELTIEQVRPAVALGNAPVTKLIEKHWGKVGPATAGEKQARIAYLNLIMNRQGLGDITKGKALFTKHCAACHQLFNEGGKVGPDLTTADRKNRGYLLAQIVDPSGYIRPEFVSYKIDTVDGRTLTGLASETGESVTLVNVVNNVAQKTVVPKGDIDAMLPSSVSLMPEKLLDGITNDEVRDLFAYLMSNPAAAPAPATPTSTKPRGVKASTPQKLRVALVSGSLEYKSDETLAQFQKFLEAKYPIACVRIFRENDENLPGLEKLESCDLAIFYTRRLKIDGPQLERVKKYVASGKPIIGLRTASHGFQNWLDMDRLAFGGDYKGHFANNLTCQVQLVAQKSGHPILAGIQPFDSKGSLYKNPSLAKDVEVLLTGRILDHQEPIAWVRTRKIGDQSQRVFYTSLGHPSDFENEQFRQLLVQAIYWTANVPQPR